MSLLAFMLAGRAVEPLGLPGTLALCVAELGMANGHIHHLRAAVTG